MSQPPSNNQPPYFPNSYPPPQPGQFYYPPVPIQPARKYSHTIFVILCIMYGIGWLFIAYGSSASQKGTSIQASIGVSIFLGVLTSVLIMDLQGSVSLQGLVNWGKRKGGERLILGFVWIGLFPFLLGIYFVRTFALYRRIPQAVLPIQSRRPTVGLVVGSIVTMLLLIITTTGGATTIQNAGTPGTIITPTATTIAVQAAQASPTATTAIATPYHAPTSVPTPTPKPQPTQPKPTPISTQTKPTTVPQLFLTFTGASAVDYSSGSVSVHTQSGAALTIVVVYCSGYKAVSRSLQGTSYADGSGNYTWNWTPQTKCRGTATADVTANWQGQSISQSDSFMVQ